MPTNPVLASMVVRVPIDVAEELQRRAAAAKMPIEQLASLALRGWLQDRERDDSVIYRSRKTAEELADAITDTGGTYNNWFATLKVLKQEAAS